MQPPLWFQGGLCLIEAGNTYTTTQTLTGYPATLYTAALVFNRPGIAPIIVNATADGEKFVLTITGTTFTNATAGQFDFAIYLTKIADTTRSTYITGVVNVEQNLAVAYEPTEAEAQLTALNATIDALMATGEEGAVESASFNGQSYTKRDLPSLYLLQTQMEAKVYREKLKRDSLRGDNHSRNMGPVMLPVGQGIGRWGYPFPYPFTP
jgi:hypothetical protein